MTKNSGNAIAAGDRIERLENAKAGEAQRMALARLEKAKAMRNRVTDVVVREDGRTFTRKKVTTTVDRLCGSGKIDKGLRGTIDVFAQLFAEALGMATVDGDDSSNRLTASYEGGGGGGFGSRTVPDRTLDAMTILRRIYATIPPQLQRTFSEIAHEEIGALVGKPRTLAQIGSERGYLSEKQASACGGTEVAITAELIAHLVRLFGAAAAETGTRVTLSQQTPKTLTRQGVLEGVAA